MLSGARRLLVYECDGLPQHKHPPRAVIFPETTEQVSELLKLLSRERVSFAPRGAGTGLSGGALSINRGVVIEMARMRRILSIDPENRLAVVQTGLVNAQLSRHRSAWPLLCSLPQASRPHNGGNIARTRRHHCLKLEPQPITSWAARFCQMARYRSRRRRSKTRDTIARVFVGSEGTFGIATEATVRLYPFHRRSNLAGGLYRR